MIGAAIEMEASEVPPRQPPRAEPGEAALLAAGVSELLDQFDEKKFAKRS
jgi:hypothetical protein